MGFIFLFLRVRRMIVRKSRRSAWSGISMMTISGERTPGVMGRISRHRHGVYQAFTTVPLKRMMTFPHQWFRPSNLRGRNRSRWLPLRPKPRHRDDDRVNSCQRCAQFVQSSYFLLPYSPLALQRMHSVMNWSIFHAEYIQRYRLVRRGHHRRHRMHPTRKWLRR